MLYISRMSASYEVDETKVEEFGPGPSESFRVESVRVKVSSLCLKCVCQLDVHAHSMLATCFLNPTPSINFGITSIMTNKICAHDVTHRLFTVGSIFDANALVCLAAMGVVRCLSRCWNLNGGVCRVLQMLSTS